MTACQTLAQSLSASPSATTYPTTLFSLPPPYHYEISDLSAYNRSFPSKIKCCVDRLSWLFKSGQTIAGQNAPLSAIVQKQTHAPQHRAFLFNHLVGEGDNRRWYCEAKRLGSFK